MKLVNIRNETMQHVYNHVNAPKNVSYRAFCLVRNGVFPPGVSCVWTYKPDHVEDIIHEISRR